MRLDLQIYLALCIRLILAFSFALKRPEQTIDFSYNKKLMFGNISMKKSAPLYLMRIEFGNDPASNTVAVTIMMLF